MISPSSEVELSELLLDSSEPIRIIGGGTRQNLGNNVPVSYTHLTLPTIYSV